MRFEELRRIVNAILGLHPPVGFLVGATRAACLHTLIVAARPSQDRLHLRDLFAEGRRYYIQPIAEGFTLTSNISARKDGRRLRTRSAATVIGVFDGDQTSDPPITFVRLRYRAHAMYLLTGMVVPAFISSILIYLPWHPLAISALVGLLFSLTFIGHRLDAALQVGEMVFFVQKVLEDLPPVHAPELQADLPGVVMRAKQTDFMEAWERFYEERLREEQE
jgi:hypothetical protein